MQDVSLHETRVIGYYTSWSRNSRAYYPDDVPLNRLTHMNYAFMDVKPNGEVTYGDPSIDQRNLTTFKERSRSHPTTAMQLSIGGWALSGHFSDAAASQTTRDRFARTAIDLMRTYDFDGIDIDWEYPTGGGAAGNVEREDDPRNFIRLLETVRSHLAAAETADGKQYTLSVAVSTDPKKTSLLDVSAIADLVDYASVMNYDYTGLWSSRTNHNSKLYAGTDDPDPGEYNADAGMRAWTAAGMPKAKLVFGMAFFGWGFSGVPAENNGLYQPFSGPARVGWDEPGATDYYYVSERLATDDSYNRHWDTTAKVPWAYSDAENVFITYENPRSIGIKAEYVETNGYGGVMFWECYGDREGALLDALELSNK